MAPNMVIDPLASPAVPTISPVKTTTAPRAAAPETNASPSPGFPNPRIEFDAKLGVVVLEFLNPVSQAVTQYPNPTSAPPAAPEHDTTA
jgi:hypothetical protein